MVAEVLLTAEGLGKTYGTVARTVALSGVDFEVQGGEFASVIGQSGSGKSTLLNLIGLLDTPTEGRVVLNGHDTAAATRRQRAALRNDLIGFVFQFHYLLPEFTALENVLMPGRIAGVSAAELRPRAEETLALLGLEGLERKNAKHLSGGQKQRVAIARALMNRPALVLADEPTGNLDSANGAEVIKILRDIVNEGKSVVLVTHNIEDAKQADVVFVVSDGSIQKELRK
jgi:lipoprotein-releasing system ATP-binding protein